MTFPEQIIMVLKGAGLENIYNGMFPHSPAEAVVVRVGPGLDSQRTHDFKTYERPRIQIIVRAANFETAWSRAELARDVLTKVNTGIDTTRYLVIRPVSGLADHGEDGNQRRMVGFNCEVIKEA